MQHFMDTDAYHALVIESNLDRLKLMVHGNAGNYVAAKQDGDQYSLIFGYCQNNLETGLYDLAKVEVPLPKNQLIAVMLSYGWRAWR